MRDSLNAYARETGSLPANWWFGVSVESPQFLWRIDELFTVNPITFKFVSFEPLLENIPMHELLHHQINLLDWIIVGGESDLRSPRPMDAEWATTFRDFALQFKVPFFFKQWGGRRKCECHHAWGCRLLQGRLWDEFPMIAGILNEARHQWKWAKK